MSRRLHIPEAIRVLFGDLLAWKSPSRQLTSIGSLLSGPVVGILDSFELVAGPKHLCRVHQFSIAIDDEHSSELALIVTFMKLDLACARWCSPGTVQR